MFEKQCIRIFRAAPARVRAPVWLFAILLLFPSFAVQAAPKNFASPEAAVAALVEAVKANDQDKLNTILGRDGSKLLRTRDPETDRQNREAFVNAYGEGSKHVMAGENQAVVVIGRDDWPLPIPLVRTAKGWHFDARQGEQEIRSRRIGRHELAAIQVCLAIVDAEREYATHDYDGDGMLEFAPRFVSSPGKHDGLYWQSSGNESLSPIGPLLTAAARDASDADRQLAPFHGYYYRILTKQGKNAPGGAYDYMVHAKMLGGFAVIAYPAHYGKSGVMSFIVNHDGKVYEKDLGKNTDAIASGITSYDPDPSWKQPAS
jgi:hypothetical protein